MAKIALLIGVSEYQPGLNPLPAAVKDVEAMREVLVNTEMGDFNDADVTVLKNPQPQDIRNAIYDLFANRQKDDLLLFYFSGHGIKDDRGNLYFSTCDTRKDNGKLVTPSAVAARTLHDSINDSRSQRQVIILDCCFSGAIAQGMSVKDDGTVNVEEQLGGKGRAILTSSTSTQYSFEQEGSELSIYTRYLVEGVNTGVADKDGDGWISIDELHEYAKCKVQETSPAMTPEFYPVKEGHKILLAKSPKDDPKLLYRQEVETRAQESQGAFSIFALRILEGKRQELNISPEEANAIKEEVLQPYREYERKRYEYEQTLIEAAKKHYPFSQVIQKEIKEYQQYLGLRDEDIAAIEKRVFAPKQAEYEQQQEVERLKREQEKAEYQEQLRQQQENKLQRYEQELFNALKAGYPLDDYVISGLKNFQQFLGLSNEDVESIEHQFINSKISFDKVRGEDLAADLIIDFLEAVFGCEREIGISHLETCEVCQGSGIKSGNQTLTCINCNGYGQVKSIAKNFFGSSTTKVSNCPTCKGTGKVIGEKCSFCDGKTVNQVTKKLQITIPSGVDNGKILRVSQEANAGLFGGSAGDLYLYLFVNEHKEFKRDGINILSEITISYQQALSGCRLNINTVDGVVELTIPPKTQPNTAMKLENRGVPCLENPISRGDHLIKVVVKI